MKNRAEFDRLLENKTDYYGTCEICGADNTTIAPFGKNNEWICPLCAMNDPLATLNKIKEQEKISSSHTKECRRRPSAHMPNPIDIKKLVDMALVDGECSICHIITRTAPLGIGGNMICIPCGSKRENAALSAARITKLELWAAHEVTTREVRLLEMDMEMAKKRENENG